MIKNYQYILKLWLVSLLYLLLVGCGAKKYDWFTTYQDKKNHVYGTYIVKKYLDNMSSDQRADIDLKLYKFFDEDEDRSGNYLFVGDGMLASESDAEALVKFVEEGNQAFISTTVLPNSISSLIFDPCRVDPDQESEDSFQEEFYEEYEESVEDEVEEYVVQDSTRNLSKAEWKNRDFEHLDFSYYRRSEVRLNLQLDSINKLETDSLSKSFKNEEPYVRQWYYLHDSLSCKSLNDIKILGYLEDTLINFFEIPYGDGSFYIHTNPLAFTNASMLNDKTSNYVESIISLGTKDVWYWDDYSRSSGQNARNKNQNSNYISSKGPLTYILKQEPLKWAWYSLLAMGGFFLVFRAKRKQRVVPILEENENTSLAFINTIGNLYFNKNDHKQLCKDQMQLWLEDLRHHYHINTSKLDDEFVEILSAKTKKSKEEIQALLDYYKNIESGGFVSENTMVTFYQKLNKFSIQAKS